MTAPTPFDMLSFKQILAQKFQLGCTIFSQTQTTKLPNRVQTEFESEQSADFFFFFFFLICTIFQKR
jgi:hypothetical protein